MNASNSQTTLSETVSDEPSVASASNVLSSAEVNAFQYDNFPFPTKEPHVSHPDSAWKPVSADTFRGPSERKICLRDMYSCGPVMMKESCGSLGYRCTASTRASVSCAKMSSHVAPLSAALMACSMILVSASSCVLIRKSTAQCVAAASALHATT